MKIEYIIREKDLLETQLLIASKANNLRRRRWRGAIFITVCLLIFCLYLNNRVQSFDLSKTIAAIAISIFAGGLYFFLIPYIYRRHYVNQVKTHFSDIIGNSVELQITDDSVETRDETGETKMKLTAVKIVYETENLFVLQSDNSSYLTVPKKDIDVAGFRDCLVSHGLNVSFYGKSLAFG